MIKHSNNDKFLFIIVEKRERRKTLESHTAQSSIMIEK